MTEPFNPYAAPQAGTPDPARTAAPGPPVAWEPGEVIQLAVSRSMRSWLVLIVGYFIHLVFTQLVSSGPGLILRLASPGAEKTPFGVLVQTASAVAGTGLGAFFGVGLLRMTLDAARGRPVRVSTLFLGGDRFLPMLGLYFMMSAVITVGLVFLIVPGVIVMLGLCCAPFYVVDANMNPFEAMRASWSATKGQKGTLFGLFLLSIGIFLLGVLACCVGVIPAATLLYVAWAITYTRVSGREPALRDAMGR